MEGEASVLFRCEDEGEDGERRMGESSGLFDGGVVLVETTGSDTLNDFACVRVGDVGAGVDGATTGRDLVIPLGTPLVFVCTSL